MTALDGTTSAPWREVHEIATRPDGRWILLACGHETDLPDGAEPRPRYRCIDCAREPPKAKRSPAEKRAIKAIRLTPDEWIMLVRVARGEWPFVALPGANPPVMIVALLRSKGYVRFEPEAASARGFESSYVATGLGDAATVFADAQAWNESDAILSAVRTEVRVEGQAT